MTTRAHTLHNRLVLLLIAAMALLAFAFTDVPVDAGSGAPGHDPYSLGAPYLWGYEDYQFGAVECRAGWYGDCDPSNPDFGDEGNNYFGRVYASPSSIYVGEATYISWAFDMHSWSPHAIWNPGEYQHGTCRINGIGELYYQDAPGYGYLGYVGYGTGGVYLYPTTTTTYEIRCDYRTQGWSYASWADNPGNAWTVTWYPNYNIRFYQVTVTVSDPPTCTSPPNACGYTSSGVIQNGSCNASPPANPSYYGASCSASNACGTNSGTYNCSGQCSASAPYIPGNYGASCSATSAQNACGQTNTNYGSITCGGGCSVGAPSAPSNPSYYGQSCQLTSAPNSCGQTTTAYTGTYNCSQSCIGTPPAAPSNSGCAAPDLTAGAVSPTNATAGTTRVLTGFISNIGNGSSGAGFPNFFLIRNAANGGGSDVFSQNPTVGSMDPDYMSSVSVAYVFPSPGTYSAVICADYNSSWQSTIAESNENNNCGPWTNITVAPAPLPNLTAGAVSPTTASRNANVTLSAIVSNASSVGTPAGFTNSFQIKRGSIPSTFAEIDAIRTHTIGALPANVSFSTIASYAFNAVGPWYVRACADLNGSGVGSISEENESDNCGPWTTITVDDQGCSDGDCSSSLSCNYSYTDSNGNGSINAGEPVNYSASPSNLGTYTWRPSETGTNISGGSTLSRTYGAGGLYQMRVSATDQNSSICNVQVAGACAASASGDLSVNKTRVRVNETATLTYSNITGVLTSCNITNTSGAPFAADTSCVVANGSRTTPPITTKTTYSLVCGSTTVDSVTVDVIPKILEF